MRHPSTYEERACKGMDSDFFYPTRGKSVAGPREVCARCPVQEECLLYALVNAEKYGIWGGRSERERRRIRRNMRLANVSRYNAPSRAS